MHDFEHYLDLVERRTNAANSRREFRTMARMYSREEKKRRMRARVVLVALLVMIALLLCVAAVRAEGVQVTADIPEEKIVQSAIMEQTEAIEEEPVYESLGIFRCTAYCSCYECCEEWALNRPVDEDGNEVVLTASGERAEQGKTIAVDTSVIPFGSVLMIDGQEYVAQDRGGAIKGQRIDVYFDSHADALEWGIQAHEVFVKEWGGIA